jgi:hypothetical protein
VTDNKSQLIRIVSLLSLSLITLTSIGQPNNPFLSLKFDKVIMYDYQPSGEDPSLVDEKGQLISTVTIKKQVHIDRKTVELLNNKIGDKHSYGQVTAMCFNPHLGIVYYLNGKIVRHVLVCMECNELRADIVIPAQKQDKQGEGDKAYYSGNGMSKSFRKFINGLLVKYDFSHQIKPNSDFDK